MTLASNLADKLADNAHSFCRTYLSAGAQYGNYWKVGDPRNNAGGSMYVRLVDIHTDSGFKRAGRWRDAGGAGAEGDLLNILAIQKGSMSAAVAEGLRFIGGAGVITPIGEASAKRPQATNDTNKSALKLLDISKGLRGTHADRYLTEERGLFDIPYADNALRYSPSCYYQQGGAEQVKGKKPEAYPALLCKVTDLDGKVTAVNRIYLDRRHPIKAELVDIKGQPEAKKLLGSMLGNAVRFGPMTGNAVCGEGVETVLSVRCALPRWHHLAGLTANHLAAMKFDHRIKRLWVAHDNDEEGFGSLAALTERGAELGMEVIGLAPLANDHNDDLRDFVKLYGVEAGRVMFVDRLRQIVLTEIALRTHASVIAA